MKRAGVPFEYTNKPWFGPKSRARKLLSEFSGIEASSEKVVSELTDLRGVGHALQFVRLIEFKDKKSGFVYRLAICWFDSCPSARQLIYDLAEYFVGITGWYPLPQGERMGLLNYRKSVDYNVGQLPVLPDNVQFRSVASAVAHDEGCSIRLSLTNGQSILLNTGFRSSPASGDCLVFLTHIHRDHSGGVLQGNFSELPVVMSTGTHTLLRAGNEEAQHSSNFIAVDANFSFKLSKTIEFGSFPVPHLPGAVGFWVEDENTRLLFTGDICFKTSRHNFIPELARLASPSKRNCFLLDATMAGRAAGASQFPVSEVVSNIDSDLVVIGETSEHLLYAYIDLFYQYQKSEKRHSASFICSKQLRSFFRVLHTPFMRRHLSSLDAFLAAQYGTSMSAWAESRWLYWLDNLKRVPDGRKLYFLSSAELKFMNIKSQTKFIYVGRPDRAPEGKVLMDVDTSPWTLHSDAPAICDAVRSFADEGIRVALFHNMTKRSRKFIAQNNLEAEVLRFGSQLEL